MSIKPRWFASVLAIVGASLLVYSLVTAARAFAPVLTTVRARGVADPSFAGAAAGELLVVAVVRGVFALPGSLLVTLALVTAQYRARWFVAFVSLVSVPLLLLFPVGTVFAVFFFTRVLGQRRSFERIRHA